METSQRATVGLAVLVGAVLAVALFGLAPGVAAQETNATEENATFGAQVSAFMQSTAADANGTVERGMWQQEATNASNPGEVVSDRARHLERRVATLENRSAELSAEANRSGTAGLVYTARASAVRAELANLRASINQTTATAAAHGVDDERLATLQQRAGNVSGPEVAAAARTLTDGGPPAWTPVGPTTETGPPTDRPSTDPANRTGAGNGTDAGTPGDGGPPDDRGDGGPPDDAGDGGAPDESGNGDAADGGGDGGAPDEPGDGGAPDDAGDGGADAGDSGGGSSSSGGSGGSGGNAGSGGAGGQP
jgi:hypothetical protein